MSSESTSLGTPRCLLTPSSKVKFQHHESNIAYNNAVALLERHEPLFQPMLSFLSNCSICIALTKEPSAMYVEYLKDFWYTAEVDDITKDISKSAVPLPPKRTIRAGLATLGLADKDKPSLTSTELPLSQPKAPTAKKSKKKKISSSTQPKVSNDSREMNPPSTTTHLQATKEFVVTAVPIQSLDASVTAEVQDNQLKADDTTKVTV
ncbi:hypothetical protein Tco_0870869 [Tanacetum coccineum]